MIEEYWSHCYSDAKTVTIYKQYINELLFAVRDAFIVALKCNLIDETIFMLSNKNTQIHNVKTENK